ncbi:MAG: hypothetical protein EBX52_05230 [Proteobacteria bacterium]|nr:hypothetical protein [Pseudomonadota bacterium]
MNTLALTLVLPLLAGAPHAAASTAAVTAGPSVTEDLAALSIEDDSIHKLERLLQEHRGTREEPSFLLKLGELQLERAGITFRISEGKSVSERAPLHEHSLKEALATFNRFLERFPAHRDAPLARFRRARTLRELGKPTLARQDALFLISHAPGFRFLDSVLMDLAQDAQEANRHEEAIVHLARVEKTPHSPYLSMAIHKTAWSEFNLGRLDEAIASLQREIRLYSKQEAHPDAAARALRETALKDLALFHFEALHRNRPGASMEETLRDLKSFSESEEQFKMAMLHLARFLKAYSKSEELAWLKNRIEKSKPLPKEAGDVALLYYELQLEKRNWSGINEIEADLRHDPTGALGVGIEPHLLKALSDLHTLVLRNKKATERESLITPLVSLTRSIESLLGPGHESTLRSRYALAETFFELEDYARASKEYGALLARETIPHLPRANLSASGIQLRWISSRSRELAALGLAPRTVKAVPLIDAPRPLSPTQFAAVQAWMGDVSSFRGDPPAIRPFVLLAAKLDYLYFDRARSLDVLLKMAATEPATDEGSEAASLALDTLGASRDWTRLRDAGKSLEVLPFASKDFRDKVHTLVESATLRSLQEGLIARGEYEKAEQELSGIDSQEALLLRSGIRSRLGKLSDAAEDLAEHQRNEHYRDPERNRRLLELTWINQDPAGLKSLLGIPEICAGSNRALCEAIRTLPLLENPGGRKQSYSGIFRNTLRTAPSARPLWCLIALERPARLPYQDRLVLLERLTRSWEKLPPRIQLHLGPILIERVGQTLDSLIRMAPSVAALRANASSIERRVRLTRDLERVIQRVSALGWVEIGQKGASSLRELYTRLVSDLKAIQTPADLLIPIEKHLSSLSPEATSVVTQNSPTEESLLHSKEIQTCLPGSLWNQWEKIADEPAEGAGKADQLLELADSLRDGKSGETTARLLKGAILAFEGAPATGLSLIEGAPDSRLKQSLIEQIRRLK